VIEADARSADGHPGMDERRERPRRLRQGRRLSDGTVVVVSHDDEGRVVNAIRYDASMEKVLEELEGEAAEVAYGRRGGGEVDFAPD
jgi:hypothetical protein